MIGTLMAITNTMATIPGIIVPIFVGQLTHGNVSGFICILIFFNKLLISFLWFSKQYQRGALYFLWQSVCTWLKYWFTWFLALGKSNRGTDQQNVETKKIWKWKVSHWMKRWKSTIVTYIEDHDYYFEE